MNDNDRRSNKNVSLYLKKHFSVSAVASAIAINLLPLVAQAEEIIMIGDREIDVTIAETRQEAGEGPSRYNLPARLQRNALCL